MKIRVTIDFTTTSPDFVGHTSNEIFRALESDCCGDGADGDRLDMVSVEVLEE